MTLNAAARGRPEPMNVGYMVMHVRLNLSKYKLNLFGRCAHLGLECRSMELAEVASAGSFACIGLGQNAVQVRINTGYTHASSQGVPLDAAITHL
jgi:hypothetical protein